MIGLQSVCMHLLLRPTCRRDLRSSVKQLQMQQQSERKRRVRRAQRSLRLPWETSPWLTWRQRWLLLSRRYEEGVVSAGCVD